MVNLSVFLISILVLVALAVAALWLLRRAETGTRQLLEKENNSLQLMLKEARGKEQLLLQENFTMKAQAAAAGEKASMSSRRVEELEEMVKDLQAQVRELDDIKDGLDRDKATLETKLENLTATRQRLEQESRQAFSLVASQLLEQSRKTMTEEGKASLSTLLSPLQEQIKGLNKEIKDYQDKQDVNTQLFSKEVQKLVDANKEITQEATRLSNALTGNNKIQGDWGEGVLKRILDLSGLQENVHYKTQVTRNDDGKLITNDDGKWLRPDFTLIMPDGKNLIIDCKVSLTAFVDYVNTSDPATQEKRLHDHIASMKAQVDLLSKKEYVRHMKNAADFALMFVPSEPAYLAAMQGKDNLWEYAYSKRVVIISPTHMLSVAQLLMQLWSRDKQSKNAEAIAQEVMKLINKLEAFATDMDKIQQGINSMQNALDAAQTKLNGKGGVMSKGTKIKQLAGLSPALPD